MVEKVRAEIEELMTQNIIFYDFGRIVFVLERVVFEIECGTKRRKIDHMYRKYYYLLIILLLLCIDSSAFTNSKFESTSHTIVFELPSKELTKSFQLVVHWFNFFISILHIIIYA